MLSPYSSRIWVGLNPNSDATMRQGVVNIRSPKGKGYGTTSMPMIIRPESAIQNGLSYHHYRNVIAQLRKMSIDPVTIEIETPQRRYVYDGTRYETLLMEEKAKPLPKDDGPMPAVA